MTRAGIDSLNIVVVCVDTFRADIVGSGKKFSHIATPSLDQLASESVRFTRCFGEAEATIQVRNGCFTGMRGMPFKFGYYGWHEIPDEYPTVAEILVQNGYCTGLIGDTPHLFKPNMNYTRGFLSFEQIRGQTSDSWKTGAWDLVQNIFKDYFGDYVPRAPQDPNAALYSEGQVLQYLHNIRDRTQEADWFAPQVFSSACRWIEDNARNRPFYLWIDCFEPHEIFDPPLAYIKRYNNTWTGPKYQQPRHILSPTLDSDMRGGFIAGLSEEFVEYYKACYMGEVTFTDKYIGMFLERLDRLGLTDSTVVIFFTDHGTELADHTGLGKRNSELHPFNTQQNLTIRHPDRSFRDCDIDAFVQNHDLAPTILDLAAFPQAASGMDGHSVWPLVMGKQTTLRDYVITGWTKRASVRDDRWNYATAWDEEDPEPELYDLQADPEERQNMHEQRPEIVSTVKQRLEELLGGPIPRAQNQDRGAGAVGNRDKPLYATSYAPLFYSARMHWDNPRALPK